MVFKKWGALSLIFILSDPFQSESEWWFVFHGKNLLLLDLVNRSVASTSQLLLKSKDIKLLSKINF